MNESIDATQPGIDRIGDVAGFLISAAETPFMAAAGELLGTFKDGFKKA